MAGRVAGTRWNCRRAKDDHRVDSSALIAIAKEEADAEGWVALLKNAGGSGDLIVCEIVAAEYYALIADDEKFEETFRRVGLLYCASGASSAKLAGQIFRKYRDEGGPREHLIPEFLIGAHALEQAERIAAKDRGYLRRYFPRLKVIHP